MGEWKTFRVSSLSSAAEQRRLFAMHFVLRSSEVEEEDGDRQEEEEEIESGEANQRGAPMIMTVGDNEVRSELEPWNVKCETITTVEQCAVHANSVHVRHASVEVNVVIGVVLCGLLVDVRVVPVLFVML